MFEAKKDVFELVHAGVGKEQRRVVGRNQRRRVHAAVPFVSKNFKNISRISEPERDCIF